MKIYFLQVRGTIYRFAHFSKACPHLINIFFSNSYFDLLFTTSHEKPKKSLIHSECIREVEGEAFELRLFRAATTRS